MRINCQILPALVFLAAPIGTGLAADSTEPSRPPAWTTAADSKPPMSVDEAKAFIGRLHAYVCEHHLKKAEQSEQRGMLYEYYVVPRAGKVDQYTEGEALDTMHDGSWYAAAMVNAARATGDDTYRKFLAEYQVPFYCRMLNHSDTLFSARQDDAGPKANVFGREHMFQKGEKGFVPYWWDDGMAVSLERPRKKNPLSEFPCRDRLAGRPNPDFRLDGYSLGSSNHLAQDLGIMVEQCWLLFRQLPDDRSEGLTADLTEAAKNLHECRMRHHGVIPMSAAPTALIHADEKLMKQIPDPEPVKTLVKNHYYRALYDFKPGEKMSFPGFADDEEYLYYYGTAKAAGKLPANLALKMIYDAYTQPLLYRAYSDDAPVPPGINRFDLHPYYAIDGKPTDYRSDRKGPSNHPRPIGSRMGPQNMVVCGWALQALKAHRGVWDDAVRDYVKDDARVVINDMPPSLPGENATPDFVDSRPNFSFPHATMLISSTRSALVVDDFCDAPESRIEIFSRPDGQGTHAIVALKRDKSISVTNDNGDQLRWDRPNNLFAGNPAKPAEENVLHFSIPYTFVKGQKQWLNAVEMGRYSIRVDDSKPRNFVMASEEAQVEHGLRRELAGGLRTWEAVFNAYGYIPTGIDAGSKWDGFSDTGGYAHLISAASEWILELQGKADWEVQNVPAMK